jgi:hypothetical protein
MRVAKNGESRTRRGICGWLIAAVLVAGTLPATLVLAQVSLGGEFRARPERQMDPGPQAITFPRKFEVLGPEVETLGFAVTQPGPLAIDVQAEGAPILVTLQSADGKPITQPTQGGALRLNVNVTPEDVRRSLFWTVQVRLAQPMPPKQGGRAAGSVNVFSPPVDGPTVQRAIEAASNQAKQLPSAQEMQGGAEQLIAQLDQAFQQRKAQFEQQQEQRSAALLEQVRPQVEAIRLATSQGAVRAQSPVSLIQEPSVTGPTVAVPLPGASGATGTGSPPPVQPPPPNPVITSISASQGQRGDPVVIRGTGFGTVRQHVIFDFGPERFWHASDVGNVWSNTQIITKVPFGAPTPAVNGRILLIVGGTRSNYVPFRFEPRLQIREIRSTADKILMAPVRSSANEVITHTRSNPNFASGSEGNDEFMRGTRLRNGWVVDSVTVTCRNDSVIRCDGGAQVWDFKPGTDWPYLNVRWWLPPDNFIPLNFSRTYYSFAVRIVGPEGVPDGVVIP